MSVGVIIPDSLLEQCNRRGCVCCGICRRKRGAAPAIAVYVDIPYAHWILCEEIGRGRLFRVLQEEGRGKKLSFRSSITPDRRVNGGRKIVLTFTVESIDREGRERISISVI